MKSLAAETPEQGKVPELIAATEQTLPVQADALARARAFAEPFIAGETLDTGENTLGHADAVAQILKSMGGSEAMQAASYLVYASSHLNKPQEVIAKAFGENYAALAIETTKLVKVQQQTREAEDAGHRLDDPKAQTENVRKMLLAFSRDLRVVMLRLASRLQTLRFHAARKTTAPPSVAREALNVFAPLANRLGIWQVKWEMEDLAFRFLEPETYQQVARLLDEKRTEREGHVEQMRARLEAELKSQGIHAHVHGRPKHIYSIVRKMRGKSLDFDHVFDVRALRVIVPEVKDCYAALSWVHEQFDAIGSEFDDYIARPKPNGYQSLHTVVRDDSGRPIEIQIRTQAMHDHAEHGVAAHWAYKEAGSKGYGGVSASGAYDTKIAVLRQLLAWERDLAGSGAGLFDDRIYVLTPDAAIIELPQGATPVDFAYSLHTSLGHRCRGARVDGVMVPLNTQLKNGQTCEIITAKGAPGTAGPSRDWLSAGYAVSTRTRSKIRAWFHAIDMQETLGHGRALVEKSLQREGKTAVNLEALAHKLGFGKVDELFLSVGKDEFSLRHVEQALHDNGEVVEPEDAVLVGKSRASSVEQGAKSGVLVVGTEGLMTVLAKCCKPAPPDSIVGFVTRGKGVSIHRATCKNFEEMRAKAPERVIFTEWGSTGGQDTVYPVDIFILAGDRQGLLRDISEIFSREKINVIGVNTQSAKGQARMTFTAEISSTAQLLKALNVIKYVSGVLEARRS